MRNSDEILKNIANLTHSAIKKLCVDCGESLEIVSKDKIETLGYEVKDKITDFTKLSNAKIYANDKEISVYEIFAECMFRKLKYELSKSLYTRKIKAKKAINKQQRKLCKSYLQKAKKQSILAMINGYV